MNYTQLVTQVNDYCENSFPTDNMNVFIRQAEQRIYNTAQPANLRKNVTVILTTGNKYLQCPTDFLSVYSLAVYPYNSTTATGTSGLKTIVVASTTGIAVGQQVTGTGIGTNALVSSIASTTITLTVANTGTVSGAVIFQGDYLFLLNKDVNFIRQAYPTPNDTGAPKYYALFGPTIVSSAITNELSLILGPTPDALYYVELHYYYYPESITTAVTTWLGDNFDTVLLYGSLVEAYTYMKGEADLIALYDTKYKEALALAKRLGDGMERQDAYRSGQYRQAVT
jgi:hypothetical protein